MRSKSGRQRDLILMNWSKLPLDSFTPTILRWRESSAMVYVFTYDEQMAECCGCGETPNNLDTLSVDYDLTANPLTSVVPTTGVIKIVSAAINNFPCDPTANVTPTPDLRAWATHIQYDAITETQFLDATLSAQELAALQSQCAFIGILGSGHGVCQCGTGAVKPAAKKKGAKK